MSEISSHRGVGASHVLHIEEGVPDQHWPSSLKNEEEESSIIWSLPFLKKVFAELLGTYFLIFVGCAAITVDVKKHEVVTLPGIAIVWGLAVMVLVYSLGHISGAHFNPAVTVAFATCGRFPWKQVLAYVFVQVVGSTLANFTLRIIFIWEDNIFAGTKPSGSDSQSLAIEIIISLFLMFVISAVSTDSRAVSELTGLVVGATVVLNVMFTGPISGASMNPARSIGSAIVSNHYKGIWIYIVGPSCGTILGAWAYNMVRSTNKPLEEITKTARVSPFSRAADKALTL